LLGLRTGLTAGHLLHLSSALRRHLRALLALLHQCALRLGRLHTLIHAAGRHMLGHLVDALTHIAGDVGSGRQYCEEGLKGLKVNGQLRHRLRFKAAVRHRQCRATWATGLTLR
jgi:hypothetical protein